MRNCRACIGLENQMQERIGCSVRSTLTLQTMVDFYLHVSRVHIYMYVCRCMCIRLETDFNALAQGTR
jgi:hypothetical protein